MERLGKPRAGWEGWWLTEWEVSASNPVSLSNDNIAGFFDFSALRSE